MEDAVLQKIGSGVRVVLSCYSGRDEGDIK
jgi:hypothetical protein